MSEKNILEKLGIDINAKNSTEVGFLDSFMRIYQKTITKYKSEDTMEYFHNLISAIMIAFGKIYEDSDIKVLYRTKSPKSLIDKILEYMVRPDKADFKCDENATWETICIKSYKELINLLKKLDIYEDYLKEQEQFKEDTELLNNPKLKEVKFAKYRSWETGGKFLILNEQVDKTTFSKLSKAGMYYHHYHADNEERFNGYCIEDTLENKIKLAKLGLKAK